MTDPAPAALQHHYASVNGIRMHYVAAGEGELVLFLHGFPQSWYAWRHQLAAVTARGYRAVAPDQRGYNETEARLPYDTDTLQADVLALLAHLGATRAHVVGHDWGAGIAWLLAIHHPEAVASLTIINAPHPELFRKALRTPRQLARSWYFLLFQLPWLPERLLASGNYRRLARSIIRDTRPGTYTREDVKQMLTDWRAHGLGGGINWYRALLRQRKALPRALPKIAAPTLMIWGEDDHVLGRELTSGTDRFVEQINLQYLPAVSHWVPEEAPQQVNALLLDHLARTALAAT